MRGGLRVAPRALAAAGVAFAVVLPLFLGAGSVALDNLVLAAAYVVMALGLNVVVGFAGLLDLGYVAFFAIGAYVAAHFGLLGRRGGRDRGLVGDPAAMPASTSTSCSSSCSRWWRRRPPAC